MSTLSIRSCATDSYHILSSDSVSNTNDKAEVAITKTLIKGSLETVNDSSIDINGIKWNYSKLSEQYVDTSAITNYPAGTVTKNSVILLQHKEPSSIQSYTTTIRNQSETTGNEFDFKMLPTSASLYDSNYVIIQSHIANLYDNAVSLDGLVPEGAQVKATFDQTNTNHNIQRAVNCAWNTTTQPYTDLSVIGPHPTFVKQAEFNRDHSFGMDGARSSSYVSKWVQSNTVDGSLSFTAISPNFQPNFNNLIVEDRTDFANFNVEHDTGVFRIQQNNTTGPLTNISLDNNTATILTPSILEGIPLMDQNSNGGIINENTLKSQLNIPGTMNQTVFNSLFNTDVLNTIVDGYNFNVIINDNDNGAGYNVTLSDNNVLNDRKQMISEIDNSNILDNPFYMQNYVNENHNIEFSDAGLTINSGENGVSTTPNLIEIDLTYGETLTSIYAGVDGEIKINSHHSTTRTSDVIINDMDSTIASDISVWYQGDSNIGSNRYINTDMMYNPYFGVYQEKVAKQSNENSANVFKSDNNAFLTLYTNQIINENFDKNNTNFMFNDKLFSDDSIRLWKIKSQNSLVAEPESLFTDYNDLSNTADGLVNGISVQAIMQNLVNNNTDYNSYRCKLNAKVFSDIGLYSSITTSETSNWKFSYADDSDSFLKSSSEQAFNDISLPNYDINLISDINSGLTQIYYKYEYKTNTNFSSHGGLQDYIQVTYGPDELLKTNVTIFNIPQTDIMRTYGSSPTTNSTVVAESRYSLTGLYSKEEWQLVQTTKHTTYSASFNPKYGTFTNIILTINNISQDNTYYALQHKQKNQIAPPSALQYVNVNLQELTSELTSELTTVYEIISSSTGSLSITGLFSSEDLKAFKGVIEARKTDNQLWEIVSDEINFDTYYALDNINELTIEDDTIMVPDVITVCEYTPFTAMNQESINLQLSNSNYYIPFVYNHDDVKYSISSFVSSPSNIPNTTNLSSTNREGYFTVTDNYACTNLSSWDTNEYSILSKVDNDDVSTLTVVKKSSDETVITITRKSNDIFLGTHIVTYIPKDIWRSVKVLGESLFNNVSGEVFESTVYPNNILELSNVSGIQINVGSTNDEAGCSIKFTVLSDFVSVNLVGSVSDPTSSNELGISSNNNGSLQYQFIDRDSANFSGKITLDRYRGFPTNSLNSDDVQVYSISRGDTSVTFKVKSGDLSQTLTSKMYYGQKLSVNDLRNGLDVKCANLGISFNALYSLHPTGAKLLYPVIITGDKVTVTISNDRYTGSANNNIPVPDNSTPVINPTRYSNTTYLNSYGTDSIYTFSGIFKTTSKLVAIRPSRVKLQNALFNHTSLSYTIKLSLPSLVIYKAKAIPIGDNILNYLGDPESYDDINNTDIDADAEKWVEYISLTTYNDKLNGVNIGRKKIRQDPNMSVKHAISYFVSIPPYYTFETISTADNIPIPYYYETDYKDNRVVTHLPYYGTNSVFTPFSSSTPIYDISNNDRTITHNPLNVNNITFTILNPPTVRDLFEKPDTNRYAIIVPGTRLTITLYTGLYESNSKPHILFDKPVTSLPSAGDVINNKVIFKSRDTDGAIHFSLAQDPTDIGYQSGLNGYETLFRTDDQSKYYNIDLKIDNVSWFNNNNPVTYFNAHADGVQPTLYTVVDLNNPVNKQNYRRVYKYSSASTFNFQDHQSSPLQTLTLTFTQGRKYCDTPVNNFNLYTMPSEIDNYSDVINSTTIEDTDSLVWTDDELFNSNVYVSWAFGNAVTANNMAVELFHVNKNTQKKWVYLTLSPFESFLNQFGLIVSEVSWDGSVYTPMVSTQVIKMHQELQSPNLSQSNSSIQQYSIGTL
jgi:hypothetical protein